MSSGYYWILAEWGLTLPEAQIARHDYAHEGWFTKLERIPATRTSFASWNVWVSWTNAQGQKRQRFPACCQPKSRWLVDEDRPNPTWTRRILGAKEA